MLTLNDGTETTFAEVKAAVDQGAARLVHSHGNGKTLTSLTLDGRDIDTRGQCSSVWDEVWTTSPRDLNQALHCAGHTNK